MACISYIKLWESDFYNNGFAKDKLKDVTPNQIKLKVNNIYRKDQKRTTNN